jgi:hypothetical protein
VTAPVQVLVVGFDQPNFSGEVLAEFTRLGEAGIVRLVDLLLVARADDGTLETLPAPDGFGSGLGVLAAELLGQDVAGHDGGAALAADEADVGAWSLDQAVPVGTMAAVALIEHTWAGPVSAAIRRAGGHALEETWLAPGDLETLERLIAGQER